MSTVPSPDELASAHLDDELDALERAVVEADPGLLERVEQFRYVRGLVAEPVPLVADRRESLVAAALQALHEATASRTEAATRTPAHTRTTATGRRWFTRPRALGLVAAAAAVGAVLIAGRLVDDSPSPEVTSELNTTAAASDPAAAESAGTGTAAGGTAAQAPDLGAVSSPDEVLRLVEDTEPLLAVDAPNPCAATAPGSVVGRVSYQGVPAIIVRDVANATTASGADVRVVDEGCRVLVQLDVP